MSHALASDDPRIILKARLLSGVRASDLCLAIMGWLSDTFTEPRVMEARLGDGQVWLRLSNEQTLEPVCSFLDFLEQVRIICISLHLSEDQSAAVVAYARQRLSQ